MKTTIATVFALTGAALVAATEFPPNMPECGKVCGNNMLGQASALGCPGTDIACLCGNPDFGNGIRDCSLESCGDVALANIVIGWGNTLCSGAGVNANIPTAGGAGAGSDATASPVTNTEAASPTDGSAASPTTDGSAAETTNSDAGNASSQSEGEEATAITTSAWTSVITGDGVTSTVTGETTIFGIGGVPVASTTLSATTSPIVSTHTDESTTFETTVGTSTFVPNQSSDAAGGQASDDGQAGETSQSQGFAAQATAAPIFGFLAAAGVAAALF